MDQLVLIFVFCFESSSVDGKSDRRRASLAHPFENRKRIAADFHCNRLDEWEAKGHFRIIKRTLLRGNGQRIHLRTGFPRRWTSEYRQRQTEKHHPHQIVFLNGVMDCKTPKGLEEKRGEDDPRKYGSEIPANAPKRKIITITAARNHMGRAVFPGLPCPMIATTAARATHKSVPSSGLSLSGRRRLITNESQPKLSVDSLSRMNSSKSSTNVTAITTNDPTIPKRNTPKRISPTNDTTALTAA